ncbi:MAG: hypothetical protein ACLGH0_10400 [Thermoanaerobaculia bacterium]
MKPATLAAAEAARDRLASQLTGLPELRGIGIAVLADGFGVKVNLSRRPADIDIPDDVDGVPVLVDVVGRIESL